MPLTINIPDTLRRAVESGSGGLNTVRYTAKGQPCYMTVIPKFDLADIPGDVGSGTHPAFIVDGVEKPEILIGQFTGHRRSDEMISAPGVEPIYDINHDQSVALARANGPDWHVMTNAEWGAVQCVCLRDGHAPGGNNADGRDYATGEHGVRADGLAIGSSAGDARTLTGSGPPSWRHDGTPFGLADLHGNVWEWAPGLRILDYEINVLANNDAASDVIDMSAASPAWQAIDGATGALVAPGSAGTVRYASSGEYALNGSDFPGIVDVGNTAISSAAMQRLRALGCAPLSPAPTGDYFNTGSGERLPLRGGNWGNASAAGLSALNLTRARGSRVSRVGCRPAFVA